MCEPVTAALAAMGGGSAAAGAMAGGSMLMTALGGYSQYKSISAAAKANAQIAENNAKLAMDQAVEAQKDGAREQQQSMWKQRAMIGAQKVAAAANGISSENGSAYDLIGETALLGGMERQAIELSAARKAWGYEAEATNTRNESALAQWQAKQNKTATVLGTVNTLMNQAGQIAMGMVGAPSAGIHETSLTKMEPASLTFGNATFQYTPSKPALRTPWSN